MPEHAALRGLRVLEAPELPDGDVLVVAGFLHVGTRRVSDVEHAAREARYIVRRGMADVLEWLGQDVGPRPAQTSHVGHAILAHLEHAAETFDGPWPLTAEGELAPHADRLRAMVERDPSRLWVGFSPSSPVPRLDAPFEPPVIVSAEVRRCGLALDLDDLHLRFAWQAMVYGSSVVTTAATPGVLGHVV